MKKPSKINLNDHFKQKERKKLHRTQTSVEVRFDKISPWIVKHIREAHSIVGCIAWLSDPDILKALVKVKRVDIIVTSDRFSKRNKSLYQKLQSVRVLGRKTGRLRPLMHHKFLVGFSKTGESLWCFNGSYNFSNHSKHNLENCMRFTNRKTIHAFIEEFKRLKTRSRGI